MGGGLGGGLFGAGKPAEPIIKKAGLSGFMNDP